MWSACVTHVALEGLLSGVCAHVFIQAALLTEGLVALAAFIWLLLEERGRYTDRNTGYKMRANVVITSVETRQLKNHDKTEIIVHN